MPNVFDTPAEQITQTLINLVGQDAYLIGLVSKNYEDETYAPGKGNAPVSLKVPSSLFARERDLDDVTTKIVLDSINEQRETIHLDPKHTHSAVGLSEADLNLNLTNFTEQVLAVQAEAIIEKLEHKVATKLQGVPLDPVLAWDESNPIGVFTKLRKRLRDNGVAQTGLQVVVGTDIYAQLLDANAITDVSQSGSTAALREGGVGKVRGFTLVESNRIGEGEILALHRDAVSLVTRAPMKPLGASYGAAVSQSGFSLRYLRDYDQDVTQDRSLVSTFSAVGILPTFRVLRDEEARKADIVRLPFGGVLRLDADAGKPTSAAWAASTAYAVGDSVSLTGGQILVAVQAGTSDSTEPTAPGRNQFVTDGDVIWQQLA